jgi:hypothetical protein
MSVQLERINPKFRQLTDQLCFSDRLDLDLVEYKSLLRENFGDHYIYLLDRLQKCTDIFWQDGEKFWAHRFDFLFSLNEKTVLKNLEDYLEARMFQLVKEKRHIDIKYDIEYLQFVEFCKVKHSRNESLLSVKNYLIELPSTTSFDKLTGLINSFIPFLFKDINEYAENIIDKITYSTSNFEFLLSLEKQGIKLDKRPIVQLIFNIITERSHCEKNNRAFFYLFNNGEVRELFKKKYRASHKIKLISLLGDCSFQVLDEYHLRNIKNLLELDPSLADSIVEAYVNRTYERDSVHKTANADKLIRLVKICPEISARKILAFLSSNDKVHDIKYMVAAFPDLKKLAAFV